MHLKTKATVLFVPFIALACNNQQTQNTTPENSIQENSITIDKPDTTEKDTYYQDPIAKFTAHKVVSPQELSNLLGFQVNSEAGDYRIGYNDSLIIDRQMLIEGNFYAITTRACEGETYHGYEYEGRLINRTPEGEIKQGERHYESTDYTILTYKAGECIAARTETYAEGETYTEEITVTNKQMMFE